MAKIKILKEPGFLYDLSFLFYLNFNQQICVDQLPNDSRRTENAKYFNETLRHFGEIPDDLYVFFHSIETNRCFFSTYYLNQYSEQFTSSFSFNFIRNELYEHDKLVKNMIRFYLHKLSENELKECEESKEFLFDNIKRSNYSDKEKIKLYEFFINPTPYIRCLQNELIEKENMLSDYYKNNYEKIIDAHNKTSFDSLKEQMLELKDLSFLDKTDQTLYVSYCLINRLFINSFPIKDGLIYALGYDYTSVLDFVKEKNKEPALLGFGTALSDESRINILLFILNKGEINCKDLEKEFAFSGSTAYHHLCILTKSGILKTRNDGKTILYYINKNYLYGIIDKITKTFKL